MKHYLVEGNSLSEAYHNALLCLNENGIEYPCSDYNTNMREISLTFQVKDALQEPMISRIYPGGYEELQQYVMEICDGLLDFKLMDTKAGLWEYTYHDRFVRQLPFIIEELTRNPESRRAVMNIRDFEVDSKNEHPACLQSMGFYIRDGKLHMKVMMRSNDSIKASFMNAFAFIQLQVKIAAELNVIVGSYSHTAFSYHVYERDYALLEKACEDIEYYTFMPEKITYNYEDFYKELMEESIPDIIKKVDALKENMRSNYNHSHTISYNN